MGYLMMSSCYVRAKLFIKDPVKELLNFSILWDLSVQKERMWLIFSKKYVVFNYVIVASCTISSVAYSPYVP